MRITLAFLTAILVAFSCQNSIELESVIITGEVKEGDVEEVKFVGVIDNSIGGFGEHYVSKVDSGFQFSIEIPIDRLAKGRISAGEIYQDMVLLPGDHYNIRLYQDSVYFKGKGAAKNNFLIALNQAGLGDRQYSAEYNKGMLPPIEFLEEMKDFMQKRVQFLETYPEKSKLESEFKEYFRIETLVIYENRIHSYPRQYARKNKVPADSLKLSEEYERLDCFENFMHDEKVISFNYIHNLRNLIARKAIKLADNDSTLSREAALHIILLDSLRNKTKEYSLAQWLITELSGNRLDTILYNAFLDMEKDHITEKTFKRHYLKFTEKQSLIGQTLHTSFIETIIIDTSNTNLSFEDMLDKYKGKVVYLDIWSLRCAPCISAMPHSKALKERLVGLPIEFVYIAQDPPSPNVWNEIFKVTATDENHYRMDDHIWGTAKMLQFMEIDWVPCYMIFDKQGKLIDFNANRPYVQENNESALETRLKQLAIEY